MIEKTYSTGEVADMVNRAHITIRQLVQKYAATPKPIGQKIGRDWRLTEADIERVRALCPPDVSRLRRHPKVAP